jgi:hypothetical protein
LGQFADGGFATVSKEPPNIDPGPTFMYMYGVRGPSKLNGGFPFSFVHCATRAANLFCSAMTSSTASWRSKIPTGPMDPNIPHFLARFRNPSMYSLKFWTENPVSRTAPSGRWLHLHPQDAARILRRFDFSNPRELTMQSRTVVRAHLSRNRCLAAGRKPSRSWMVLGGEMARR